MKQSRFQVIELFNIQSAVVMMNLYLYKSWNFRGIESKSIVLQFARQQRVAILFALIRACVGVGMLVTPSRYISEGTEPVWLFVMAIDGLTHRLLVIPTKSILRINKQSC